jgi:DNA-binding MurR/RpiR family transcriptional regulator
VRAIAATRFQGMELRIGVIHTGKELMVELDGTADDVVRQIETALRDHAPVVWFTDAKGRRIGATADKIGYIEIEEDGAKQRVGFGRS